MGNQHAAQFDLRDAIGFGTQDIQNIELAGTEFPTREKDAAEVPNGVCRPQQLQERMITRTGETMSGIHPESMPPDCCYVNNLNYPFLLALSLAKAAYKLIDRRDFCCSSAVRKLLRNPNEMLAIDPASSFSHPTTTKRITAKFCPEANQSENPNETTNPAHPSINHADARGNQFWSGRRDHNDYQCT